MSLGHDLIDGRSPDARSASTHRGPLSRIGGACAVLYTATLIVALSILAAIGLLNAERAVDALPILARHQTAALLAGWLFVIGPVFLMVAGLGLLGIFRQAGSLAWIAALTFIAGNLMALIRNIVWLAMAFELAPVYANATEDVQEILATVGDTLIRLGFIAGDLLGGMLVAGIGVPLFSAAILRTKRAVGWVAWLGFAIAPPPVGSCCSSLWPGCSASSLSSALSASSCG